MVNFVNNGDGNLDKTLVGQKKLSSAVYNAEFESQNIMNNQSTSLFSKLVDQNFKNNFCSDLMEQSYSAEDNINTIGQELNNKVEIKDRNKSFVEANQDSQINPITFDLQGSQFFHLKSSEALKSKILESHQQLKPTQSYDNGGEGHQIQISQGSQLSTRLLNNEISVPSLSEWYQQLATEDKQLAFSLINSNLIESIITILVQCRDKGHGVFKLVQHNLCDQAKPQTQELKQNNQEVLDFIRFTHTHSQESGSLFNLSDVPKTLNTLCLSLSTFQNDSLIFELAEQIVGKSFLQSQIKFEMTENQQLKSCTLPQWLDSTTYHSPTKWMLFLFEVSLQYQYQLFLTDLDKKCTDNKLIQVPLVSSDNQLIDSSNKLHDILFTLKTKYQSDDKVLFDLVKKCEQAEIQELSMIIVLFMNQEPAQLSNDLSLTSIYKLQTAEFESERDFMNLLISMTQSKASESQKKAIKNQKKKNKRKQKKAQQQQQTQQSPSSLDPLEEEKEPNFDFTSQQQEVNDFKLLRDDLQKDLDHIITHKKRKESHKEPREQIEFQDIFSDSNIFQLLELEGEYKENDRSQANQRLEKLSSFSESTVDILGNFSSETFKNILKSPQHSSNTEIELDIRKNLYSSDAGDSSMQLQKQFSDYYFIKDSSNINIDVQNHTKTKESIDNLQIDVSISNDNNTLRQDDSAKNDNSKKVTLQLPNSKKISNQAIIEDPINNFQIIRSSHYHLQEQQALKQSQRRKKNKNTKKAKIGTANQNQNLIAQQKQMNNFIRNILHHDENEDDYDEYEQYATTETPKTETTQKVNKSGSDSKKSIYVKKQGNPSSESKTIQELTQNTDSSINLIKSSVNTSVIKKSQESQAIESQFHALNESSKNKKKSFNKSKKSGSTWDKNGKRKGGKSKGQQPSQSQLAKQGSFDPQYNQGFGLNLPRQSSMFESQYLQTDLLNPLLNGGQIDIEEIKHMLQQNIIQDTIQQQILAQQQHQLLLQQNQDHLSNEVEIEESLDDDQLREQRITETFFELLESQMINYQKFIEKKLESVRKERETAIQIIRSIVSNLYKDERNSVAVKLYGSMASNLSIDTSDVDLAVVGLDFSGSREKQVNEMKRLIEQINLIMKKSTKLKFIETATVPVIKLEVDLVQIAKGHERSEKNEFGSKSAKKNIIDDNMRYLGIDITYEDTIKQHYYGLHIENLSRINLGVKCINYIKELCKDLPGLQTIVLVLKKLLQVNDLNQTFTGGLNSYSIVLMTTAYIKQFKNVSSMSKNLMEFFNFYGQYFDPQSTVISSAQFPHFVKYQNVISEPMIIYDPLDVNNNPAKGAYQIGRIQSLFKDSYQVVMECLNQFKQDQKEIDVIKILMGHQSQIREFTGYLNSATNTSLNQLL